MDIVHQSESCIVRHFHLSPYEPIFAAMQAHTSACTPESPDEIWIGEHEPVFTLGQTAQKTDILTNPNHIPEIHSDRGGKVTYHGPGQLILYPLINLKRHHLTVRTLVSLLENSIVLLLKELNISAYAKKEAPGVYVHHKGREAKIASLGLRIRKGFSYHGASLNAHMDLSPFDCINPCGMPGLHLTQIADYHPALSCSTLHHRWLHIFLHSLQGDAYATPLPLCETTRA